MRTSSRIRWTLWFTAGLWLLVVPSAAAYLDPGTGSVIFQAVIAGVMAASVGVKVFWGRIRNFFSRRQTATPEDGAR